MTKNERFNDSIGALFTDDLKLANICVLKSSTDMGVRRNFGRAGSRYSPKSIINILKKMTNTDFQDNYFAECEVACQHAEIENFENAQLKESNKIQRHIGNFNKYIHIGGGHDHVFPMIKSILETRQQKELFIINIDAHLDTRVDSHTHSGTPFRDIDNLKPQCVHLYQYGIHNFSNSKKTKTKLSNIDQKIFANGDEAFFEEISKIPKDSFVFLSLDADALDSSQMQAVSAVNPNGVKLSQMRDIIELVKEFKDSMFGVYEYNPIYDDLSQKGAKNICSLIYEYLL